MSWSWMAVVSLTFLVSAFPAAAWGASKRLPQASSFSHSKAAGTPNISIDRARGPARLRGYGWGRCPLVHARVSRFVSMAHLR